MRRLCAVAALMGLVACRTEAQSDEILGAERDDASQSAIEPNLETFTLPLPSMTAEAPHEQAPASHAGTQPELTPRPDAIPPRAAEPPRATDPSPSPPPRNDVAPDKAPETRSPLPQTTPPERVPPRQGPTFDPPDKSPPPADFPVPGKMPDPEPLPDAPRH